MNPAEWADYLANTKLIPGEGPSPAPIALVGEAPGLNEELYGRPFVGEAGNELTRMLTEAGLDRTQLYLTNVFKTRPPDTERAKNDITTFFVGRAHDEACTKLPPFTPGKFVRRPMDAHIGALFDELHMVGASTVIALGNVALWGLLGQQKISKFVGTIHPPSGTRKFTVIPTYHPAAILRQYSLRTTTIANLRKAAEHSQPSGTSSRKVSVNSGYKITINPSLAEVEAFAVQAVKAPEIAIDVETAFGQIRTIAFTIKSGQAFVIPFWEPPASSYWPSLDGEVRAWRAVKRICESPGDKIFQNGLYDIQYLWRVHGIRVLGRVHDTMAFAHASQPELPRSLGYLAATYLNMPEWKTMRVKSEKDEE